MLFNLFKRRPQGPDFSDIKSLEDARTAAKSGRLRAIFIVPQLLGGVENPANVLYVPDSVAGLKDRADDAVFAAAQAGKVARYECTPQYEGDSFVPVALQIEALDSAGNAVVSHRIGIWGTGREE
ncbi:hypothetical protein BM477_04960 [Boudabousia marimammalium]|uniref:Uncharacterized protein n=2 Tax=Boudabousia marimammalium TaxID=156892 RepID=A0A1Q5PP20_9ACTO|nr:hypothetical protein BM477_04960 [Boudabousia marimammalium]